MAQRFRMAVNKTRDKTHETHFHIFVDGDDGNKDYEKCAEKLARVILSRTNYKDIDKGEQEPFTGGSGISGIRMEDGVYVFNGMQTKVTPFKQYVSDVKALYTLIEDGPCLSTCRSRLKILEGKFAMYSALNSDLEDSLDKYQRGGGVNSHSTKVDNSVRLSTAMNAQVLVDHIMKCVKEFPDEKVLMDVGADGTKQPLTVSQLFKKYDLDPVKLTVEGLGLHPVMQKRFHRFDIFDDKLNRGGKASAVILKAFLKNSMGTLNNGRFFADGVRPMLDRVDAMTTRIRATEYKIPIFGNFLDEWATLADWIRTNNLCPKRNNMWIIQIPRIEAIRGFIYSNCKTNEDQLRFIFEPLFMATIRPDDPKYASVAWLLQHVGAFNMVSDETIRHEQMSTDAMPPPAKVPWNKNPSDIYFMYYLWANICSLNALRRKCGLNTFQFRPTCGEVTPHFDQLVASFLLADSINHGIKLQGAHVLQYLYLFNNIGLAMSPLSNNSLYVPYQSNPFLLFFRRGMNVSLSTDDPLHYHHNSEDPLLEEYVTAMRMYKLTPTDISEVARNSVVISSFPMETKKQWLGSKWMNGPEGNEVKKSSVCNFRLQFRQECLQQEQNVLNAILLQVMKTDPICVTTMRRRRLNIGTDNVREFRTLRRMNYTDSRVQYPRLDVFGGTTKDPAQVKAGQELLKCIELRNRYNPRQSSRQSMAKKKVHVEDVFRGNFNEAEWDFDNYYGVFLIEKKGKSPQWPASIPTVEQFIHDVASMAYTVVNDTAAAAYCKQRLQILERRFNLHLEMNLDREAGRKEEREFNNRDFYTAHKVDNNIQTDAGMNARTLFRFFMDKAINHADDVVFEDADQTPVMLGQLIDRLGLSLNRFSFDQLTNALQRYPQFHDVFLSPHNYMGGRYFAELTAITLQEFQRDKYTFAENRLTLTGQSEDEWGKLAHWFDRYGMASPQNRWIISLSRNYGHLKRANPDSIASFGDFLENIFRPLWEVSLHPGKYPKFHYFLSHISGFDSIDNESRVDVPLSKTAPHDWTSTMDPPYNYYMYYYWANIVSLNEFREKRGLSQFTFRPQSGENGVVEHVIGGFLLADSITHGLTVAQFPTMEYLFYATQVGIAMSPLSNTDKAQQPYLDNPFALFFRRGLLVSLATNQPLHFHFTQEPLIEEISIAAKIWKLSMNDICELSKNSVLISGFSSEWKCTALGDAYFLNSSLGNEVRKSRLSDIRVAFRYEVYHTEMNHLDSLVGRKAPRAMRLLSEETKILEEAVTGNVNVTPLRRKSITTPDKPAAAATGEFGAAEHEEGEDLEEDEEEVPNEPITERLRKEIAELTRQLAATKQEVHEVSASNAALVKDIDGIHAREEKMMVALSLSVAKDAKPSSTPPMAPRTPPPVPSAPPEVPVRGGATGAPQS